MTRSESKFRQWVGKRWPSAFVRKYPDYKQGAKLSVGMPDYMVIYNGTLYWFEVKQVVGTTINLERDFTDAQINTFPKLLKAGSKILIYIFSKNGTNIIDYELLRAEKIVKLEQQLTLYTEQYTKYCIVKTNLYTKLAKFIKVSSSSILN